MRVNHVAILLIAGALTSSSASAGENKGAVKAVADLIAEKINNPQVADIAITFYSLDEQNPRVGEKIAHNLELELKSTLLAVKRYHSVQIAPSIKDPRSPELLKRTNWFITGTYLHRGTQSALNWKLVDPTNGGSTLIDDKQSIDYPKQ